MEISEVTQAISEELVFIYRHDDSFLAKFASSDCVFLLGTPINGTLEGISFCPRFVRFGYLTEGCNGDIIHEMADINDYKNWKESL